MAVGAHIGHSGIGHNYIGHHYLGHNKNSYGDGLGMAVGGPVGSTGVAVGAGANGVNVGEDVG